MRDLWTDEDHYGPDNWEHYKAMALRQRQMLVKRRTGGELRLRYQQMLKRRPPVGGGLAGLAVFFVLLALCYVAGVLLHAVYP